LEGLICCPFDRDVANIITINSIDLRGLSAWSKFFMAVKFDFINNTKMELISGFDSVQKRLLRGELRQNMLVSEEMTLLAPR
jgi:hypothetical protein